MCAIIDINKIKQEICENEFNSDSISSENSREDNPNEDKTKYRQKPEVVGEILPKESQEIQYVNISGIVNKKAQEEIVIKEVVPRILDDEIKYEFIDEIVKEETEDNYDIIDVKSELYNDAFLYGTDNYKGKTILDGRSVPVSSTHN